MGSTPPTKEQQAKIDDLIKMWEKKVGPEPKLPGPLIDNTDSDMAIRLAVKTEYGKRCLVYENYHSDKTDLLRVGKCLVVSGWGDNIVRSLTNASKRDGRTNMSTIVDYRRDVNEQYVDAEAANAAFVNRCGDVITMWFNKHWLGSSRHMMITATTRMDALVLSFDWNGVPVPEIEGSTSTSTS